MNLENTQWQKQVGIDVLKIFVSGSFVKEDFLKTHRMKFNPNYELQMEFSGLGRAAKYRECTRHLEKKKKKKENVQQIMRRGGVEPGFIVSGTKILTTRLPTTVNDFGSISTFKICKVLAFIGVTADRHVVQT